MIRRPRAKARRRVQAAVRIRVDILGPIRRLWFASRKLRLSVPRDALVLEVGSGDSPYPRSDVLLDLTMSNHERVGGRTVADRPLVLGLIERLPFRDKAFDFVIASHVLEHSADPCAFLGELQRVAPAGYIETPSFWVERVQPMHMHRLEVGLEVRGRDRKLLIRQKSAPVPDHVLASQFSALLVDRSGFGRLAPTVWVTQYFWEGEIKFEILNPETKIEWQPPPEVTRAGFDDPRPPLRRFLKRAAQKLRRSKEINLTELLRCVDCHHQHLEGDVKEGSLSCPSCGRQFVITDGIPHMHPQRREF